MPLTRIRAVIQRVNDVGSSQCGVWAAMDGFHTRSMDVSTAGHCLPGMTKEGELEPLLSTVCEGC